LEKNRVGTVEEKEPCTRIFVDIECTALEVGRGEIIDVAYLVEEVPYPYRLPGKIVSAWSQKILPEHIETADSEALAVNGYTPEKWEDAVPFIQAMPNLLKLFDIKGVWIGHNPSFDRNHIIAGLTCHGYNMERPERHRMVDTTAVAYLAWGLNGKFKLSMNNLRKHLNISAEGGHGALKDCYDCREVFYRGLREIIVMGQGMQFPPLDFTSLAVIP
jgi:DNA polymerase III epsilon subunit-like protein